MALQLLEKIPTDLAATARQIDVALESRLEKLEGFPPRLLEAMKYSLDGGKRLRPILVLWVCEACGGNRQLAMPAALALECVHTFSLIHDDLPGIDNDDLRRGRPTCHAKFGEAVAILAGDALLVLGFDILASDVSDPRVAAKMTKELAASVGGGGMIGGEWMDVESEDRSPDAALVRKIHEAKTARLFQAACRLGAMAANADVTSLKMFSDYGLELGMAFQASDDLLDVEGCEAETGKRTGKDTAAGKQTYFRAVGLEENRRIAREAADRAVGLVESLGAASERLTSLAQFIVQRRC